jgi:hypothetical protein
MHVDKFWNRHLAEMGNRPGDHDGDVTVYLIQPVEGCGSWTVPSGNVAAAAEAGSLVGIALELPDGRRAFIPGANVLAVIDAPADSDSGKDGSDV